MHNTPEPFTQAETFGWIEGALWIAVVVIFAAVVALPLYFGAFAPIP